MTHSVTPCQDESRLHSYSIPGRNASHQITNKKLAHSYDKTQSAANTTKSKQSIISTCFSVVTFDKSTFRQDLSKHTFPKSQIYLTDGGDTLAYIFFFEHIYIPQALDTGACINCL